jgi:drug/metabolite transporter (DMT)-like permease
MITHAPVSLKTKLALVTTILLWASAFPGIRAGLVGYSPGGLALIRFLVASFCMYLIYLRSPRKSHIPLKDAFSILLIGAVTIGTYHIALNFGEMTVPAGIASFIVGLSPIVTVIFAAVFLNERITKTVILGIVISILGVGLMTLHLHTGEKFIFHWGVLSVLLSALMAGIYSVVQKPFLKKYHAVDVTAYVMWGATLLLLIFIPDLYHDLGKATLSATIAAIYLGIFPAAIAYLTWTYALAEISASRASVSMYFLPIIATLMGWVWLDEVPTTKSFIGGLIVLLGVWLVNRSYRKLAKIQVTVKG